MFFIFGNQKQEPIKTTFECLDADKLVTSILSTFENFLDKYNISIPSDERTGDKTEARIFGKPYYDLEDEICDVVNYNVDFNNVENIEALSHEINETLNELAEGVDYAKSKSQTGNLEIGDLNIDYIKETIKQVNSWTAELTDFLESLVTALASNADRASTKGE